MRRPGTKILLMTPFAVLVAVGLLWASGPAPEKGERVANPKRAATVEPTPPLALDIRLVNLQKSSHGGVATLAMDARTAADLEAVTLAVSLPDGITFTDGSRSKSWTFDLAAGATFEIPSDLLVAEDGKYVVRAQASGTYRGKAVRRGLAFRLLVGVQEKAAPVRDGAIEYQGVAGEGGQP